MAKITKKEEELSNERSLSRTLIEANIESDKTIAELRKITDRILMELEKFRSENNKLVKERDVAQKLADEFELKNVALVSLVNEQENRLTIEKEEKVQSDDGAISNATKVYLNRENEKMKVSVHVSNDRRVVSVEERNKPKKKRSRAGVMNRLRNEKKILKQIEARILKLTKQ